jgi:hypothetical protein
VNNAAALQFEVAKLGELLRSFRRLRLRMDNPIPPATSSRKRDTPTDFLRETAIDFQ